jgi:excisionase family DNA binding protein
MSNFLTSQEMQDLISVDRSTVYRMAEDGRLPAVKVGRQWRFPADLVAAQFGLSEPATAPPPSADPTTADVTDLTHLLRPEVAQSVADLMGELFGVMVVITDMDGAPLTAVANPCGYYAAIADQPGAVEACLSQWRLFAEEPHVAPRWVQTHLGFHCARTFVWVDLKPVGMIVVGGVSPRAWPPAPEFVDAIADEVGVPHDVLLDAVDEVYRLDVDAQRRVLRLLPQMGDLVSQLASARSRLGPGVDQTAVEPGGLEAPSDTNLLSTPQGGDES